MSLGNGGTHIGPDDENSMLARGLKGRRVNFTPSIRSTRYERRPCPGFHAKKRTFPSRERRNE